LGGIAGAYTWFKGDQGQPRYVTQPVTLGDIERSVTMTGTVEPVQTVQVGSYVSGIVKEVACDYNSAVKAGQVCARIDPAPFQLVVEQNKADITTSEAQRRKDLAALTYARLTFERDNKLLQDGIVSADQVDSDRNVLTQAEAQIGLDDATLVEKKAVLHSAEVNLGYTDIISPVTGTVITRTVDVGQTVVSNLQSATLFLIAKDLSRMQVETNVAEADISAVEVGQEANFTVQAFPDRSFTGIVKQIRQAPVTVQSVVTYDVVVAVDNPDRKLLPGMTADTHIITAQRRQVLRVPLPALRFVPAGRFRRPAGRAGERRTPENRGEGRGENRRNRIWVLRDNQLTPVPVAVGLDDGTLVEVTSDALHEGDRVVLSQIQAQDEAPRRNSAPLQQQRRPQGPGGFHL
jgi:HlyD family secretion protein